MPTFDDIEETKALKKNTNVNTLKQIEQLTADLKVLLSIRPKIKSEITKIGIDNEIKRIKSILIDNIMEV